MRANVLFLHQNALNMTRLYQISVRNTVSCAQTTLQLVSLYQQCVHKILCTVAVLPRHIAINYTVVVHAVVLFYHTATIFIVLLFPHGVQLTVLHHFTVSDILFSQYIWLLSCSLLSSFEPM